MVFPVGHFKPTATTLSKALIQRIRIGPFPEQPFWLVLLRAGAPKDPDPGLVGPPYGARVSSAHATLGGCLRGGPQELREQPLY
jgi:hypothetical protein